MVRACMEGVALSLRHNLEIAEEAGAKVEVLRAMGGSANSHLWTQIKADITGKPIVVPASDTATTLGAAGQQNSLRPDLPNLPGSLQIPGPPDDQTLRVCIHLRIQIYIITSNIVPLRTTFLTGTS